ncbi:MAG: alternative ribosome rescue aminoacyl-tRNA hydrolase ArfB [Candidatus Cyclobacteriaceae bacterium M3_2C_046]
MGANNLNKSLHNRPFETEYTMNTSRSGGPGGQHVNKVETKVALRFHIDNSQLLSQEEKERIHQKLKRRINSEGYLQVFAQEYRSQIKNKQLAEKRFYQYLNEALKNRKKRIPTKPSRQTIEKRIQAKKKQAEKKSRRAKINYKQNSGY